MLSSLDTYVGIKQEKRFAYQHSTYNWATSHHDLSFELWGIHQYYLYVVHCGVISGLVIENSQISWYNLILKHSTGWNVYPISMIGYDDHRPLKKVKKRICVGLCIWSFISEAVSLTYHGFHKKRGIKCLVAAELPVKHIISCREMRLSFDSVQIWHKNREKRD